MGAENSKQGETFFSRWSRRKAATANEVVSNSIAADEKLQQPSDIGDSITSTVEVFEAKMPCEVQPEPGLSDGKSSERKTSEPPEPHESSAPLPAIDSLTKESDFSPFMQPDVEPAMRNQAMKKLFTDPHYNIMDGLDIYIDDYGKPDPIPPEMLRMMHQSKFLRLFEDEEKAEAEAAAALAAQPVSIAPENIAAQEAHPATETAIASTLSAPPMNADVAASDENNLHLKK